MTGVSQAPGRRLRRARGEPRRRAPHHADDARGRGGGLGIAGVRRRPTASTPRRSASRRRDDRRGERRRAAGRPARAGRAGREATCNSVSGGGRGDGVRGGDDRRRGAVGGEVARTPATRGPRRWGAHGRSDRGSRPRRHRRRAWSTSAVVGAGRAGTARWGVIAAGAMTRGGIQGIVRARSPRLPDTNRRSRLKMNGN